MPGLASETGPVHACTHLFAKPREATEDGRVDHIVYNTGAFYL